MRIFAGSFSSVGATKKTWPSKRSWPTIVSRARFSTLTTRPSARPPGLRSVISTCTLSPFMAEPVRAAGMKMSLSSPSTFSCGNDEAIAIAVKQDRAFDQIPRRRFVAVAFVLRELSFLDELVEDVFDLPCGPTAWHRNPPGCAAGWRCALRPSECTRRTSSLRDLGSGCFSPARVRVLPRRHRLSLLTSMR